MFNPLNAQWTIQYTVNSNALINSTQFVNENTGYVVCEGFSSTYGYIYKTTNGGLNWISLILPSFMNYFFWELYFLNANTGYVCGHSGYIYKTTNGGSNWDTLLPPRWDYMQTYGAIQFLNGQTGFIGGRYGMVAKTTNAGLNWITCDTAVADILDLHFLDVNTGYLSDTWSGVYKTTNGCASWEYKAVFDTSISHYDYAFEKIRFVNYNTGYMVGSRVSPNYGAIFKTTDAGNNWKSILITPGNRLYSLALVDSMAVYVGSNNKIVFKSTNGGNNWITQQLPTYWAVTSSVFFVNQNTGYCCAGNELMKTTNGGNVFVKNISSEIPNEYRLFQNYPNPFNPNTNIKYQIKNNKFVTLKVFDLLGREVAILVNEFQKTGTYEVSYDGNNLTSGIYFYVLYADGFKIDSKKLILLK